MSGNGRGNMRPTSRSPPFLVVGLLVAMCILAFNYWNLSSKNGELSHQFERLQVDFRSASDKHLTVEKHAGELRSQLAELQSRLNQLQHSASEKDNRVTDLTGEVESFKNQLQKAQQTLQEAQNDVQRLQQEKSSVNGELDQVKDQLKRVQEKPVTCDKDACRDPVRELVTALVKALGRPAMFTALQAHRPDALALVLDIVQGGGQPQGQPQPQNPAAGVPDERNQKAVRDQAGPQHQAAQQTPMVGQDANVVQMQQGAADRGQGFPQQGAGVQNNVNLPSHQQLPQQVQQQQQQKDQQQQQDQQHPPLDVLKGQPQGGQNGPAEGALSPKKDANMPEPVIVAQNIPHPGGDDLSPGGLNNVNDLNMPAAQEDVDVPHFDLPKDEMDKQAEANHVAGEQDNLDDNLHNQLQDLSKNDLEGGDNNEEDEMDRDEDKDEDPMDLNARDQLEARRTDEGDYDEHDQRRIEGVHEGDKVGEEAAKQEDEKESEKEGRREDGDGGGDKKGSKSQAPKVSVASQTADAAVHGATHMEINKLDQHVQTNKTPEHPNVKQAQQDMNNIQHPENSQQSTTEVIPNSEAVTAERETAEIVYNDYTSPTTPATMTEEPLVPDEDDADVDELNRKLESWMKAAKKDVPEDGEEDA